MAIFLISDVDPKFGFNSQKVGGGQIVTAPGEQDELKIIEGRHCRKRRGGYDMMNEPGCSRGGPNCFTCSLPDCEYDVTREMEVNRAKKKAESY